MDVTAQPAAEKSLTVEQVNKIVQREKAEAAQRAKAEAEAQFQAQMQQMQPQQSMGGIPQQPQFDMAQLQNQLLTAVREGIQKDEQQRQDAERQRAEEAANLEYQNRLNEAADNYLRKMSTGKEMYADFEDITASLDPREFPEVVLLASQMDGTADVMYELAKNPQKLVMIAQLAQRSPKIAKDQLARLEESIKTNQNGKRMPSAPPPLNRVQPSAGAGVDNGSPRVRDFKKQPWLRG
jgi:hypothetical protein